MSLAVVTCLTAAAAMGAEPEPLDVEFLDYLVSCEGKDDNWTVVAGRKPEKKVPEKEAVPSKPPSKDSSPSPEKQP
jgi:hypothetical protein